MNPPQGEVVPMTNTSQPNEETQELTRLFYQIKERLPILCYKDMTDESVKPVLNTFAEYVPNHESTSFSMNDAKGATANLISVSVDIQYPKYRVSPNKPAI